MARPPTTLAAPRKWPRKTDDQLARVQQVAQSDAPDDDGRWALERGLSTKVGAVAALAAKAALRFELVDLHPALAEAFGRFCEDGVKRDPGCRAKRAIVEALSGLDVDAETVFRRGLRYVQEEPEWGGVRDTAAGLRAASALALVELRVADILERLADLLADPEPEARIGAVKALCACGRTEGRLLLRLKARLRDAAGEVTGACFEGVLALEDESGVEFVAQHLHDPDPSVVDHALLALGHSRHPDALGPLVEWLNAAPGHERNVAHSAIVAHRSEAGLNELARRIANGSLDEALAVVDALSPMAFDPRTAERVRAAASERTEPELRRRVTKAFDD